MRSFRIIAATAALMASPLPALAQDGENPEFSHPLVINRAVHRFILPAYGDFVGRGQALETAMKGLCAQPSEQSLTGARAGFGDLVESWSRAEIIRFGPAITLGRMERIALWPDPKGIGRRHLRKALRLAENKLLVSANLKAKSAAIQGLTALELILYSKSTKHLTSGSGNGYACRLGAAIAGNLVFIGGRILREWSEDDSYAGYMLVPGFHNPFFRDTNAPPATLLSSLAIMLEIIRDRKLLAPLGAKLERARPKRSQWWRSGLGTRALRANFRALRDLYEIAGWTGVMDNDAKQIGAIVNADLAKADRLLTRLGAPLDRAVTGEDSRKRLIQLAAIARTLQVMMGEETARGLGVVMGFTWVDGD